MKSSQKQLPACLFGIAALLTCASPAIAASPLGAASNFAVLSATPQGEGAVTCTDAFVTGNMGTSGFQSAVVQTNCARTGQIIAPVSAQVLADFDGAYEALQAVRCERILTGTLDAVQLPPGSYCFDESASLTGTLTLSGPSTGVWTFLVNGDLTGNSFTTVMANGAQACNVFWGPSGAATMTDSHLKGSILAGAAITLTRGTYIGRALATNAVTLTGVAATACGNN